MLRPLSLASVSEAVRAVEVLYEELAEAHAEANFVEQGDFEDPGDFADEVVNNLPAIAYALNAGLPVTAWGPMKKNPVAVQRVMKAVRQWSEQARALIERLASGRITMDQFWDGLVTEYQRQSQNAYVAGRRAMGNLAPLNDQNRAQVAALTQPDVAKMQQQQVAAGNAPPVAAGGGLGALVMSQLQPINFIGSGLPGDPMNTFIPGNAMFGNHPPTPTNAFTNRIEQMGKTIGSFQHQGEMSAFDDIPEEAILVWWELGVADHCVDCIQMADLSPFSLSVLESNGIAPGTGHTQCGSNCACDLMYDAPTEVCGDALGEIGDENADVGEASREARPFPFVESEDGRRLNVWVQEADSCQMPMDVSAFGPAGDFETIDDEAAFDWDEDIALGLEGGVDEMIALRALLEGEDTLDDGALGVLEWLTQYLDDAAIDTANVGVVRYPAASAVYRYVWRETPDSLIFDFGATTRGLSTLDAEMTVKAISGLAERAAQTDKRLLINADTAGPGMRKWLDALTTQRTGPGMPVPKVVPKWDFIPPPMEGTLTLGRLPEVSALGVPPDTAKALEHYKPKGQEDLGGLTEKHLMIDSDGHEFLVKNAMPDEEAAASSLMADMGLRVAPASRIDGAGVVRDGSIQPLIPGPPQALPTQAKSDVLFSLLTPEQAAEVNRQSVMDFIVANNDAHAGQFLLDAEGRLWGIDKGLAYRDMALPEMAGANFWLKAATGTERGYPGVLFGEAARHPETSHILDLVSPANVEEALQRVDAFGADEIVKRSMGGLNYVAGTRTPEQAADILRARIASARSTYGDIYRDVVTKMGDGAPPEWTEWLAAGGKFGAAPEVAAALPLPVGIVEPPGGFTITFANLPDNRLTSIKGLRQFYKGESVKTLGVAKDASVDEWAAAVYARIMAPGYKHGTLAYDDSFWRTLTGAHLVPKEVKPSVLPEWGLPGMPSKWVPKPKEPPPPPAPLFAKGPPITAPDAAAGFKPGDPQQYLVGESPLPVNAPLASWSGYVPQEPPLPKEVLKPSKDELDAARKAAHDAEKTWHDVADGKVDIAFSWTQADKTAAENAGLVYRDIKGTRLIGRNTKVLDDAEKWLAKPDRAANTDEFWKEVMGYKAEDLAALDRYEEFKSGKRLTAGIVMVEPDGKVWVLQPKNEWAGYQNTWIKGGVDPGETTAQAAVREMREEAGFSAEIDSYLGDYMNTDKTGIARMYIGHRTGGGPMGAHFKETYKVRLLSKDEAEKALTRYKKPDARDQTILTDAFERIEGKPSPSYYVVGADEAEDFAEKIGVTRALQTPTDAGIPSSLTPPKVSGRNARPLRPAEAHPSAAFAYDPQYVDEVAALKVEYQASSTTFPLNTTKYSLPDGQVQPMYWKEEASGAFMAPVASVAQAVPPPQALSTPVIAEVLPTPTVTPTAYASVDEMMADMAVRYPGADLTPLTEMPLETANLLMADVNRVFGTYGPPPSFKGIKWAKDNFSTVIAEVKRDVPNVPGSSIYLPKDLWSNPAKVNALFHSETTGNPGWAVMSKAGTVDDFIGATLVHELGHEYMGLSLKARIGGKGSPVSLKIDAWFSEYLKTYKTNPLTKYGAKNPHEAWSEAFTAAVGPVKIDDPRINELRAILDEAYPPKVALPPPPALKALTADASVALATADASAKVAADIAALPKPDVATLQKTGLALKGKETKDVYVDFAGNQYIWKPTYAVDSGAANIGALLGVRTPEVTPGLKGGLQAMVPKAKDLPVTPSALKALAPEEKVGSVAASISDWLIGNTDAGAHNAIIAKGKVWYIDRSYAFKDLGTTYAPMNPLAMDNVCSLDVMGRLMTDKSGFWTDVHPGDVAAILDRLEGISKADLTAAAGKGLDEVKNLTTAQARKELLARQAAARDQWSSVFRFKVKKEGGTASPEWKAWLDGGGMFTKPKAVTVAPIAEVPVVEPTKRIFWANSKKQVADPHQRFNLHVAQLRHLLEKMEADPTIGALRVNEALLDQVPQLREMLIAAGAKKGGGTTELLAGDAHALYQSLLHNTAAVPAPPLIPTAPLVPVAKEAATGGFSPSAVDLILGSSDTPVGMATAPISAIHTVVWDVNGTANVTMWTAKAADGPVSVGGFNTGVAAADMTNAVTAQLLHVQQAMATNPDLTMTTGVKLGHSLFSTPSQRTALDPLFAHLNAVQNPDGSVFVDRYDLFAFAAKAKGDMAAAGKDGGAALKIDWGAPKPMPAPALATDFSTEYGLDPVVVSGLWSHGEGKATFEGKPVTNMVWTDPAGPKFSERWRRQNETDGSLLWMYHDPVSGTPSVGYDVGTAAASRQLHYMADLLDLDASIPGIRISADVKLPGATKVMLVDSGAEALGPNMGFFLPREKALALRDAIDGVMPIPGTTIYVGPLPEAMGYDAAKVYDLVYDISITGTPEKVNIKVGGAVYMGGIVKVDGADVLQITNITEPTALTAEARIDAGLAFTRWASEQGDLAKVWITPTNFPLDVQDLLLAKGGQMKAGRIVIGKGDIDALAAEILPTPAEAAKAGALVPETVPGFVAANVADGLGSMTAADVASLKNLAANAIDTTATSSKGPLKVSVYQGNGEVIWRRLGNALEVHTIDSATDNGALAHLLRMAQAMDDAPKIDALRFTTSASPSGMITGLLKSAGAKEYAGGLKLTREQTLALRDQILHTANAAEAKGATVVEAFVPKLLPTYGISPEALAQYSLTAIPQKQGFVKMAYPDAAGSVRVRLLSQQMVWAKVSAAAPGGPEAEVAFAYLRDMAHDLATHPNISSVRFDNWPDLPQNVRKVLNDYGANAADRTLTRQQALDLAAAIDGDVKGAMGLGDNVVVAAASNVPPTAVDPPFAALVNADSSAVNSVAIEYHWAKAGEDGGSIWVGPDQHMVIYKNGATAADPVTIATSNTGTTGAEYLAALQAFAAKADVKSVYIDQAALKGADGKALWDGLKAGGAVEDGGQLFLDKQGLINLADAVGADLPLAPNALLGVPVAKKSLTGMMKTTGGKVAEINYNANVIPGATGFEWIVQLPSGSMKYVYGAHGVTVTDWGALTQEDYLAALYGAAKTTLEGSFQGAKHVGLNIGKVDVHQAGLDDVLKSLGAVEKELMPPGTNMFDTYLVLDQSQAKALKETIENDLAVKVIPASAPLQAPTPASLGETFATQFEADPAHIIGLPLTDSDLNVAVGHGTTLALDGGTKFGWAFDNAGADLDLTFGWGTDETLFNATAAALWKLHHSDLPNLTHVHIQFVDETNAAKASALLDALGASKQPLSSYDFGKAEISALGKAIDDNVPLAPSVGGSAVSAAPAPQAALSDILGPHVADVSEWGAKTDPLLSTTHGPVDSVQGVFPKTTSFNNGHVNWSLSPSTGTGVADMIKTANPMGDMGALGPADAGQMAVAMFKKWAQMVDSGGAYSDVTKIVAGEGGPFSNIALAFGGKVDVNIPGVVLTKDQLKTIGTAIDDQILHVPGGAGAVNPALHPAGWTDAGKAAWVPLETGPSVMVASTGLGEKMGSFSFFGHVGRIGLHETDTPIAIVKWNAPHVDHAIGDYSGYALAWTEFQNAHTIPLVGEELAGGYGAVFEAMLVKAKGEQGLLLIHDDVFDVAPDLKAWLKTQGIPVDIPATGGLTGPWAAIAPDEADALLKALHPSPNPVGFVAPTPSPRVGLDYDAAAVHDILIHANSPENVGGTLVKTYGPDPYDPLVTISYATDVKYMVIKGINTTSDAATCAAMSDLANFAQSIGVKLKVESDAWGETFGAGKGLKAVLKKAGGVDEGMGGASLTVDPVKFLDTLKASSATTPPPPSTFLDEFITKAGAEKAKVIDNALNAVTYTADTPLAQGFGQWQMPSGLKVKYRASGSGISIENQSGYGSLGEHIAMIVKAGEKVDAAPGMTKVTIKNGFLNKTHPVMDDLFLTTGHKGNLGDITYTRQEFLDLRAKVLADLNGAPAPVSVTPPVVTLPGAYDAATIKGLKWTVFTNEYPADGILSGYKGGKVLWQTTGGHGVSALAPTDDLMLFKSVEGSNPLTTVLAFVSAQGPDALEANTVQNFAFAQVLLDQTPGLQKLLRPYLTEVGSDGTWYVVGQNGKDLAIALHTGSALKGAPPAVTGNVIKEFNDFMSTNSIALKEWTSKTSLTNGGFATSTAYFGNVNASSKVLIVHELEWNPTATVAEKQAAILGLGTAATKNGKDFIIADDLIANDPVIKALVAGHTKPAGGPGLGLSVVDSPSITIPGPPNVVVAAATPEPLAAKVGWNTTGVAAIADQPSDWGFAAKHTMTWGDTIQTGPTFSDNAKWLKVSYRDYKARYVFDGMTYAQNGNAAQRTAAHWKSLQYLGEKAGVSQKPLWVAQDLIDEYPEIGNLFHLYGAKAKAKGLKDGPGWELSAAAAKKMAEDMAANAPIGGNIVAPVAAAAVKTPAQIAKEAVDKFKSYHGIGGGSVTGSLQWSIISDGTEFDTQVYRLPGMVDDAVKVDWAYGPTGLTIESVEILDPAITVEMKQAILGDFAVAADKVHANFQISDGALQNLGVADDWGGAFKWDDHLVAWQADSPIGVGDYALGKVLPPKGADLVAPALAPPPVPAAAIEPPKPSGISDAYGFNKDNAKHMAEDMSAQKPSVITTEVSVSALTKTYDSKWGNGLTVRWAEEQQGDARILRIRNVSPGNPQGQSDVLVAHLMGHAPSYLTDNPTVDRVLVNKTALSNTPNVSQLLKDSGWKETKEYWVLGRDKIGAFSQDLASDTAPWMGSTAIPSYVPGAGSSPHLMGVPAKPTPSFIYGYDPAAMKNAYGTLVDKEVGAVELKAGEHGTAGLSHETTLGRTKVTWSVSPSGKTVGISSVAFAPDATDAEKMVDVFAAMQKVAEDAGNRTGFFWIKPDVYNNTPSMAGLLKDVGGSEANYSAIGEAIQMTSAQAKLLGDALRTDAMTGLTITTQTTSEYLGFNKDLAKGFFFSTPKDKGRGVLEWATGPGSKGTTQITRSADGVRAEIVNVTADDSVRTLTVAGQLNWLVENGATDVLINNAVLGQVTKLDKWLLSVGATVDPGGLRLTDAALFNARKTIMHDALPVPLGGKAMTFTFVDEMLAVQSDVIAAAHSEIAGTRLAKSTSTFVVGGREVQSVYEKSSGNIFWSSMDRGSATLNDERAAVVAQVRSFANQIAQNASLKRLDVSMDILRQHPGLRAILKKYGATEIAGTADHPAYLSLERGKALKLRSDIEKELGAGGGTGATYIGQQAALISWPTTDELTKTATHVGGQQADKVVYADAAGNQWLFKPSATGVGAEADRAAAELALMLGLPVPPLRVYTMEINGKAVSGSLQKMVPGSHTPAKLSDLTPGQTEEMWQHTVLDWAMNNDDAHIENYLIGSDGHLWAIDKTRAFKSFGGSHDVLDANSLGQGGTEALAPVFFKFFKDARRNPAALQSVHPQTMVKTLRSLRDIDDAAYRRLMAPVAALRAKDSSRYAGNAEKMLDDMLARKHAAANDLADFIAKELRTIKTNGGSLPRDWEDWLKAGKFNLDATPDDLLRERLAVYDGQFGTKPDPRSLSTTKFDTVKDMMQSGYGSGVRGSSSAAQATAQVAGPGHVSARSYHYEGVIPTLRLTAAGSALADEWIARNEWLVLHALFDADTSWVPAGGDWAATLRKYYNPDKGTIRLIRSTAGYGSDPATNLNAYTRYGFRNLMSHALDRHFSLVGDGVYIYDDVRPEQFFTSMFGGFTAGESEIAVRDLTIDQVVAMRPLHRPMNLAQVPKYNGPVVGGP